MQVTKQDTKQDDHRSYIYTHPEMYLGVDEQVTRQAQVYDVKKAKVVGASINFPFSCERLFLEVLNNASDHVIRSRKAGIEPCRIDILMDNSTITIINYGLPIPIEMHPIRNIYIPQMIFGSIYSSFDYDFYEHKITHNGIGVKVTNIFSTEFKIIIHDHVRKLKYTQVWNNNMTDCSEPVITSYNGDISSVQVVYKMDFARFGYRVPIISEDREIIGGYPEEAFALFARHAHDVSHSTKTTVTFNGLEFKR